MRLTFPVEHSFSIDTILMDLFNIYDPIIEDEVSFIDNEEYGEVHFDYVGQADPIDARYDNTSLDINFENFSIETTFIDAFEALADMEFRHVDYDIRRSEIDE